MKALVMIRVSTVSQELVDQHKEMEVFCREEGYDELVFVEDKGASAIKLNDQYRLMIDQVKEEIVKRQIKRVTSSPEWFGKDRDSRAVRPNAQCITIETMYSGVRKFIYVARKYKGHKFFVYGTETPLFTVRKIVRPPLGKLHPRAFKKLKDW